MSNKFDYVELMRRVEYLSNRASEEQLRIYRRRILELRSYLPKEYTDYHNLLHNIALKWHPQKKEMLFMDSVHRPFYKHVYKHDIKQLFLKEYPDEKRPRNSILAGSALTALGCGLLASSVPLYLAIAASVASTKAALAMTTLLAFGFLAGIIGVALVACVGLLAIFYGVCLISDAKDESKLYKTNEKLNETIDSFEKEVLSFDCVDNDEEGERIDKTQVQEEFTSEMRAVS